MIEIDEGQEGSGGPYINWHVQASQDESAAARSFSLWDGDTRTDITGVFKKGVVLDIQSLKTGWGKFNEPWKWNEVTSRMMPNPSQGEDKWQKGFSIIVALNKSDTALWQQHGAGVFKCLTHLAPQLRDGESGKLPKVKMTGVEKLDYGEGKPKTAYAKLEVVSWIDRPDCLKEQSLDIDVADDDDDDDSDGF